MFSGGFSKKHFDYDCSYKGVGFRPSPITSTLGLMLSRDVRIKVQT
ncbi:hypothetical protein FHT86_002682 [Rhizobium sp. BK313]|jgi:hypothetical protein|nr:hypothetical protein [Rhizobium sp. BK313]